MYTLTFQKLEAARKLAKDIAEMESGDEVNTRSKAHISELEALLYSRAGTKPRADPAVTETENRIKELIIEGMNDKKLAHTAASKSNTVIANPQHSMELLH